MVYTEKIAENERKIEQLSRNIKRDTEKRKKLMEDNAHLSYLALCEKYQCKGQNLLDVINAEHQQVEQLKASGLSDAEIAELADSGHSSDEITFYDKLDNDED